MSYDFETGYGSVKLPGDNLVRHSETGVCAIFPAPKKDDLLPMPWALLGENSTIFSEEMNAKTWQELAALPLVPANIYTPYLFLLMDGHEQPKVFSSLDVARCYIIARRVLANSPNLPQQALIGNILKNTDIHMKRLGQRFAKLFTDDAELMDYASMLKQQCKDTGSAIGAENDTDILTRFIKLLVTQQVNFLRLCEEQLYEMFGFWTPTAERAICSTTRSEEYFVCPALPEARFEVSELAVNYLQQKALLCGLEFLLPAEFAPEEPFNKTYFRLLLLTMLYSKEDIKA